MVVTINIPFRVAKKYCTVSATSSKHMMHCILINLVAFKMSSTCIRVHIHLNILVKNVKFMYNIYRMRKLMITKNFHPVI